MAKNVKKWLLVAMLGLSTYALAIEPDDPYERYNRLVFKFNDKADQYVMAPIARGYRKITPKPVRTGISNFFGNIRDINSFGSNLLRGNLKKAGEDFMRVALNSTFGLGGLLDIATEVGMPNNKNTLGDTFASWGWKRSHYFMLPLIGPTTVRDGLGNVVHMVYSPVGMIHEAPVRYSLGGVYAVDTREHLLDATDTLNEMALDKYAVTRNAFMVYRDQQVGIAPPESSEDELVDPESLTEDNQSNYPDSMQNESEPVEDIASVPATQE